MPPDNDDDDEGWLSQLLLQLQEREISGRRKCPKGMCPGEKSGFRAFDVCTIFVIDTINPYLLIYLLTYNTHVGNNALIAVNGRNG